MAPQAARAGDDDLCSSPQSLDLAVLAHAAIDRHAACLGLAAQVAGGLVDLFRQLAGRCHHKDSDLAKRAAGQALQNRQHKGSRFSGAGLGQSQDVTPLEDDGDGLLLNGGRRRIARRPDARVDTRVKGKLFEIHEYSSTRQSQVALLTLQ